MLFLYLNTGERINFCTSLVRDSLHSINVILCDALVLNKRYTSNKRCTKVSVKFISATALNRGFTVVPFDHFHDYRHAFFLYKN